MQGSLAQLDGLTSGVSGIMIHARIQIDQNPEHPTDKSVTLDSVDVIKAYKAAVR
jgi:hypothetical protein